MPFRKDAPADLANPITPNDQNSSAEIAAPVRPGAELGRADLGEEDTDDPADAGER